MVHINSPISNESYKIIIDVKLDKNFKKISEALEFILKEYKKNATK